MLLIHCPYCGPRPEHEFLCGGEAHLVRPGPAEDVDDKTWANYLFLRQNPKGLHHERWIHSYGCGQWFNVIRDTTTHEIKSVYKMSDPDPREVNP